MISRVAEWEAFKAAEQKSYGPFRWCVVCDEPMTGARRVLCGTEGCAQVAKRIYQRGWIRLRRAQARA